MLVKLALLFLVAMVILGIVGKVLYPDAVKRRLPLRRTATCSHCGRPRIGKACDCSKKS